MERALADFSSGTVVTAGPDDASRGRAPRLSRSHACVRRYGSRRGEGRLLPSQHHHAYPPATIFLFRPETGEPLVSIDGALSPRCAHRGECPRWPPMDFAEHRRFGARDHRLGGAGAPATSKPMSWWARTTKCASGARATAPTSLEQFDGVRATSSGRRRCEAPTWW